MLQAQAEKDQELGKERYVALSTLTFPSSMLLITAFQFCIL